MRSAAPRAAGSASSNSIGDEALTHAEEVLGDAERVVVGDADLEMPGHMAPSQHRADRLADRRSDRRGGSAVKAKVGVPTDFSETAARLACLKVTLADASILRKLRALHPDGTCPHCVLLEACWV